MKFVMLFFVFLSATYAFGETLTDRFLKAQAILEVNGLSGYPMEVELKRSVPEDSETQTEAQVRLLVLTSHLRTMANAVYSATPNPTEQSRTEICSQATDISELMNGSEYLDGFGDLSSDFLNIEKSHEDVTQALLCTAPCAAFHNHVFESTIESYDGDTFPINLSINEFDGIYSGTNRPNSGVLLDFSCTDGGRTLTGKWRTDDHERWFSYTMINDATGDFNGSWGDYDGCIRSVRGQWTGHY